jgi:hypothetical protein
MSDTVAPPIVDDLLPPLLTQLLAASTLPQPPPSLLPLLAPILRNRLQLLATAGDSWLSLLTWNGKNGIALASHVATLDATPHPSSGELELGEVILHGIQRIDEETLKAAAELAEWGLMVVYVWCTNDPEGEDDGWRVLDVHTVGSADDSKWHSSIAGAEAAFASSRNSGGRALAPAVPVTASSVASDAHNEDDDDDYWDMYDRSSAATPAVREVANPPTEDEYFNQYAEVEPALDYSPPTRHESYRRDTITSGTSCSPDTHTSASTPPTATSSYPYAPRPLSSDSNPLSLYKVADRLEESANHQVQVEVAAKQHISTSVKSLYRLAKAAGIGRDEFEALIHTEISLLSMMDDDA